MVSVDGRALRSGLVNSCTSLSDANKAVLSDGRPNIASTAAPPMPQIPPTPIARYAARPTVNTLNMSGTCRLLFVVPSPVMQPQKWYQTPSRHSRARLTIWTVVEGMFILATVSRTKEGYMIPIFEQGRGRGIGHSFGSFQKRFDEICRTTVEQDAKSVFAFILYDFNDDVIRTILKERDVFTKLDRLAGERLSIFFLHSGRRRVVKRFNTHALQALGITDDVTLPCVVFFRTENKHYIDVSIAALDVRSLVHAFSELDTVIRKYLAREATHSSGASALPQFVHWITSSIRFASREAASEFIKQLVRS